MYFIKSLYLSYIIIGFSFIFFYKIVNYIILVIYFIISLFYLKITLKVVYYFIIKNYYKVIIITFNLDQGLAFIYIYIDFFLYIN